MYVLVNDSQGWVQITLITIPVCIPPYAIIAVFLEIGQPPNPTIYYG